MFMAHEHEPHRPRLVVLYSCCCCIVVSVNFGTVFTLQPKRGMKARFVFTRCPLIGTKYVCHQMQGREGQVNLNPHLSVSVLELHFRTYAIQHVQRMAPSGYIMLP